MAVPVATLKTWFQTGDKPTQEQFWALIDAFVHKDETLEMNQVEGLLDELNAILNGKADKATTLAGYNITDPVLLSSGSYADPIWLASLAWSKITGKPTTLAGYGITD